jgi:integrase
MHMIKKGQMISAGTQKLSAAEQFYSLAAQLRLTIAGLRLSTINATQPLEQLRAYWRLFRPHEWLFPGRTLEERLTETSIQKAFTQAKARAGIQNVGGIHSLHHAYATWLGEWHLRPQ